MKRVKTEYHKSFLKEIPPVLHDERGAYLNPAYLTVPGGQPVPRLPIVPLKPEADTFQIWAVIAAVARAIRKLSATLP